VRLPQFIAICGNPTSGKTEVSKILQRKYGFTELDSGRPLREIGMNYFGLTRDQVYTQAGKLEFVEILGKRMQVREFLGEVGNRFEEMFGAEVSAYMVHQSISPAILKSGRSFVDASCRKSQGYYWQRQGAAVIEVTSPTAGPSKYKFDLYDPAAATHRICNFPHLGLARLEEVVDDLVV
jgi:hypothetical protein